MNTLNIANKIVALPKIFYDNGNVSMYSLLKETGYFEGYNKINQQDILESLSQNAEYAGYWLRWSENKRSSSGWYIKEEEPGKIEVGYFPASENHIRSEYEDMIEACAAFIKNEIDEIRLS